ncbi:Alcohol dehydrogenase [Paraliobacillus sp. PM-2]|uniref:zinc-binding dehydrogenase n=1 Tax=Paraliobacillus sp. PM-2 TaxID=1462524 RepID=UPI00061C50A5|nr:zinc-binding dehydrogenase [Paraliobacillus sp. PM-2]CQR47861.1 Alcohol dehydrogenase [Paraliobacillus sp. PM-2]
MKAFVHEGEKLLIKDVAEPDVKDDEVKISIKVAGLNHRDLHIPKRRGNVADPLVLGSDGAGVVEMTGKNVTNVSVGDEVIINPGIGWLHQSDAPPESFEIVGMPDDGTFAEKYVVDQKYVEKKPSYLSWEEAGVLALAALTGYRALFTKGKVSPDSTVFLPGAGSGVVTYMIQFAKAIGARVIVTSRSAEKKAYARSIGADLVIDTEADWDVELQDETIDLVIESIGKATFNRSLSVLRKGGRMVTFGATTEDQVTIDIRQFFYGQYQLFGSTMGSREELRTALKFMEKHQIYPVVDKVLAFDEMENAFKYLDEAKQFGKIAVQISKDD